MAREREASSAAAASREAMDEPARPALSPIVSFALGVASALLGAVLAGLEAGHTHASLAHLPHQLLLAAPLAMLGGLALGEQGTRRYFAALGWATLGLVAGNGVLLLAA